MLMLQINGQTIAEIDPPTAERLLKAASVGTGIARQPGQYEQLLPNEGRILAQSYPIALIVHFPYPD